MADVENESARNAAKAWREVRPLELEPDSIEVLSEKRKSSVYRLRHATRTGSAVIAKHCMHWGMRVERTIYEEAAEFLSIEMPGYYGCTEENGDDRYWLFLEDVGNRRTSLKEYRTRARAGRWLASLHRATATESAKSKLPLAGPIHFCSPWDATQKQLPERGIQYYYWTMLTGCELLLSARPTAETSIRKQIEDICSLYDEVSRWWPALERLCSEAPQVITHGDLVEKNLCIKNGTGDVLIVVDWESAGWGTPAVDLAAFHETIDEDSVLIDYCAIVRSVWSDVNPQLIRRIMPIGVLCRALASIYWEAHFLPYSAPATSQNMFIYTEQLSAALTALDFARKR